jgi:hypothetical protein
MLTSRKVLARFLGIEVMNRRSNALAFILITFLAPLASAQSPGSKLDGMWSDPPATTVGSFCFFMCTDTGIERLNALLDDPKNDARPFAELQTEAREYEVEVIRQRLTDAALKTYPIDQAENPSFLRCEPPGLAQQMFMPHQFEIRTRGKDRIDLRYGEWEARRTIYLDGRKPAANQPLSKMGFSVGRWDGDTLVVETSGIAPGIAGWPQVLAFSATHSDQLRITERYSRSVDGKALMLTATVEDPWSLREPLILKKIWRWAPESKIAPYKDCQRPTEFSKGVQR